MKHAILALALSAGAASAQPLCMGTADMLAGLASGFGEYLIGAGLSGGTLMQIIANPETGTWTLLASTADGRSCVVAAGSDWASERPRPNL